MLFRPEQKHRSSGENHISIPVASRNRDVNDSFASAKLAAADLNGHIEIATAACRPDVRILFQAGGNAKRIPDAIPEPRLLPHSNGECGWNARKRRCPPQLAILLRHERMALAEASQAGTNFRSGGSQATRNFSNRRRLFVAKEMAVNKQAQAAVEF
jgi:hypothetical protein